MVALCVLCHKMIHGLFSNTQLRNDKLGLDSVEGLLAHPKVQAALVFIKKQEPGKHVKMKQARGVR